MRYLVYFFLIIFNFFIQTTILNNIAIFNIKPNTTIILIVSFAFIRNSFEGSLIGFFSGLLIDAFFYNFLGLNAFIYMLVGFFAGKFLNEFYKTAYHIPIILVAIFTLFYNILLFFFTVLLRGNPNIFPFLKSIIIPEVIYTTLVSFIFYKIIFIINLKLEKFDKKKRNIFK